MPEILTPKITVDAEIIEALVSSTEEQGQIILHCRNMPTSLFRKFTSRRISNETFLVDCSSSLKSQLVHAEGIPIAPQYIIVEVGIYNHFTLIFEGLPKSCRKFNFIEMESPDYNPFIVAKPIMRNKMDVYHLTLK